MQTLPDTTRQTIAEAQSLITAAWHTSDRRRFHRLLEWSRKLLQPLADNGVGEAMWLLSSLPQQGAAQFTGEEFDRRHELNARAAAAAGSAAAMFFLGCQLDNEPTVAESSAFFRAAAEQGHAYAKWCHGLNLLAGRGTPKDAEVGLQFVRKAADDKFEGAIKFMSDAYAGGSYGFPKDEQLAASWLSKLKDKAVLRY